MMADQTHQAIVNDIAIVTRSRAQYLKDVIQSIADCYMSHPKTIRINVYDGSPDARSRQQNVRVCSGFKDYPFVCVRYLGSEDRPQYAAALHRETGVAKDIIDVALAVHPSHQNTTGGTRNLALLSLAEMPFVFFDDDVVVRVCNAAGSKQGIRFESKRPPVDTIVHGSLSDAIASKNFYVTDVLALHEQFLGLGFSRVGATSLSGSILRSRNEMPDDKPRVCVTQMGIVGHSGQSSPHWILSVQGAMRQSIIEDEAQYGIACASRYVTRIVDMFTVADSGFCMTYALGMDNRELLPPFFPTGRNSDGSFGVALRAISPERYIGHLPVGIIHRGSDSKQFAMNAIWKDASRIRTSDIVIAIYRSTSPPPGMIDPEGRYYSMGKLFVDIAQCSPNVFARWLQECINEIYHLRMSRYLQLLEIFGNLPGYWAHDVTRSLARLQRAVSTDVVISEDYLSAGRDAESIKQTQAALLAYGSLLQAWPALRKAAVNLRA
jgi:hypothetical protein